MFQEVIDEAIKKVAAAKGADRIEAERFLDFVIGWKGAECWPDEVVDADLQGQFDRMVDMIIATSKVIPFKSAAQTPEQKATVRANGRYQQVLNQWFAVREGHKARVRAAIMEFV